MDRAEAFRRQLTEWVAARRPGVPFFVLPGVESVKGMCVSCGGPIVHEQAHPDEGPAVCLRCDSCVAAVMAAPREA